MGDSQMRVWELRKERLRVRLQARNAYYRRCFVFALAISIGSCTQIGLNRNRLCVSSSVHWYILSTVTIIALLVSVPAILTLSITFVKKADRWESGLGTAGFGLLYSFLIILYGLQMAAERYIFSPSDRVLRQLELMEAALDPAGDVKEVPRSSQSPSGS